MQTMSLGVVHWNGIALVKMSFSLATHVISSDAVLISFHLHFKNLRTRQFISSLPRVSWYVWKSLCPSIDIADCEQNQQLEPTQKETLEAVFERMTAAPSDWHKDLRHLYEGVAGAITLHHQAQSSRPNRASQLAPVLAADVARSILVKLEHELKPFQRERKPLLRGFLEEGVNRDEGKPLLSAQLFVCGLLDLLNELIAAFPTYEEVAGEGKALALLLIRKSDKRAFRYKAVSRFRFGYYYTYD